MREEIRKILEMLEEGKITVEEAERLIAAVESRIAEEESRSESAGKSDEWESLSAGIENFVRNVLGLVFQTLSRSFSFIPGMSGAFGEVARGMNGEEDQDKLIGEGFIVLKSMGDDIRLKTGDVMVNPGTYHVDNFMVPVNARVYVYSMGGDVHAEGEYDRIIIKSFGGDIEFSGRFNMMEARTLGGDARIRTPLNDIRIKVSTFGGKAHIPRGYSAVENGSVYVYGDGERRQLVVSTFGGDMVLEEGETFSGG